MISGCRLRCVRAVWPWEGSSPLDWIRPRHSISSDYEQITNIANQCQRRMGDVGEPSRIRLHIKNNRSGEEVFRLTPAAYREAARRHPDVAERVDVVIDFDLDRFEHVPVGLPDESLGALDRRRGRRRWRQALERVGDALEKRRQVVALSFGHGRAAWCGATPRGRERAPSLAMARAGVNLDGPEVMA